MTESIAGKRFTVMGLGILGGGVGVARYLARHGGIVTVTDMRPAEQLQQSIDLLGGLPIIYHLGGHDEADFTSANSDVVVRNPGVRRNSPYLQIARDSGVRIEMEMSLFFSRCAAQVLGVTGTKGKTTVSTLCGEIMRAWKPDSILAGNMGISALDLVDDIQPDQPVVIELSSWQLEGMHDRKLAPHVAVLTNISPDHLNAYDSFDDYAETKRTIARHLASNDYLVCNSDDEEARQALSQTSGHIIPFSLDEQEGDCAWATDDRLYVRIHDRTEYFEVPTQLSLQGVAGIHNALAAVASCLAYGAPAEAVARGLKSFKGVPYRLEELGIVHGIRFVNDSSATAPAAANHAIRVLSSAGGKLHIIAGGSDKNTDLASFADAIVEFDVIPWLLSGSATPQLVKYLEERGLTGLPVYDDMQAAFNAALEAARAGDTIALVPGCASFGMFRNEFDRGDQFRMAVIQYGEQRT